MRAERARGHDVLALLRAPERAWRLEGCDARRVRGDLGGSFAGLVKALAGVETVFHAAGRLGAAGVPDEAFFQIHVDATVQLLRAAAAAGVRRVVHVSSPGLLGPSARVLTEDDPPAPSNVYERSKAAAEAAVQALLPTLSLEVVLARPEFVYGPGDLHVRRLFESIGRGRFPIIGSGNTFCHPTYIDDVTAGMLAVMDRGQSGRVYHLAGPRPVTIQELVETAAKVQGVKVPRRHVPEGLLRVAAHAGEVLQRVAGVRPPVTTSAVDFFTQSRRFSSARAEAELGWRAVIDLDVGVRRTLAWQPPAGAVTAS